MIDLFKIKCIIVQKLWHFDINIRYWENCNDFITREYENIGIYNETIPFNKIEFEDIRLILQDCSSNKKTQKHSNF